MSVTFVIVSHLHSSLSFISITTFLLYFEGLRQPTISNSFVILSQGKTRRAKPAHKENEAIEFEFNLCSDACGEITNNMVSYFSDREYGPES